MTARVIWRERVLVWMEMRDWHLRFPRVFTFWEWVVMPRNWGGRLGFRNWITWAWLEDEA